MSMNQAQKRAVAHKDGPCMVLAGPGSGKTLTIISRIENLIENQGVRPEEILVITFTKAAAKEMKDRFVKRMKGASYPVTIGTFHGIYYGILKWAYRLNAGNILSEEEKYQMLRQAASKIEFECDDEREMLQGIAGEIGMLKNNRMSLSEYHAKNCPDEVFSQIYTEYEKKRKVMRKIDFDDMLVLCYDLFVKRPDLLKMWQQKFKYILIDEFQDINRVQYDVIRMLAEPENNLFIVGDDDQSIYQFRGAKPEIMLNFGTDYPKAEKILLDINYRSTKSIVNGAQRVIRCNQNRYPKEIITTNEQGATVHIQEVLEPSEEGRYVASKIQEVIKAGVSPTEIAILFRTNTEARIMAETMIEYNLPFIMKEKLPNIYDHFIAQDLQTYMRMALGSRKRGEFLKIMNRPNRYIGRDSVESGEISFEKLRTFYSHMEWMMDRIDQLELDLKLIKEMTPFAASQYIRKHIGYDDFLREYAEFRKIPYEDLKEVMKEIEETTKPYRTLDEWLVHIEEYTEELKRQSARQNETREGIAMLTMHGAKGLEYDVVFIIAANETLTPHKKAKTPDEIEEERRMFYVAMTRARKQLTISYTKERNGKSLNQSRFVTELLGQG